MAKVIASIAAQNQGELAQRLNEIVQRFNI